MPKDEAHGWKFIGIGPDNKLYIPVGLPCNSCPAPDTHAQIRRINLDGSGMEVVALGVRNTVGFDWHHAADVVEKMREEVEEIAEVAAAPAGPDRDRLEEEVGDLLFSIANLARKLDVEPEAALRKANGKFTTRFTVMEQRIDASQRKMSGMTLEELEAEWTRVKESQ